MRLVSTLEISSLVPGSSPRKNLEGFGGDRDQHNQSIKAEPLTGDGGDGSNSSKKRQRGSNDPSGLPEQNDNELEESETEQQAEKQSRVFESSENPAKSSCFYAGEGVLHTRAVCLDAPLFFLEDKRRDVRKAILRAEIAFLKDLGRQRKHASKASTVAAAAVAAAAAGGGADKTSTATSSATIITLPKC